MKTSKIFIALVAILSLVNNSSWAQETIITTPGDHVVSYAPFPNDPVTKIVLEKVNPSQVRIGFGLSTNFWALPVGHPEDNSSAGFVNASLPGPYSNIGGATTVNYISWPEIWVNGVKMGNITHNGSQFSYADGITPEIFHVEQSGEYIVLKPTNSTDVVEVKHSSYFAYNGDSESPYTKLLSGVITSGPSQNVIAQLQTSYILPVSNGTYTSMTRDSYSGNSTYFSPFIVNYSSGSGINIVEKEELSIFFTSPSVLSFKSESPIQRVALYSIAGNKVVEKRGEIQELEVSYLSSGVYMVQVLLKNGRTFSQKIVK